MIPFEFRGKSTYVDDWRIGSLVIVEGKYHIVEDKDLYECGHHIRQETDRPTWVKKETVGQYTDLKDKNDRKIYDGDILKSNFSNKPFGIVEWNKDGYFFINTDFMHRFDIGSYRPLGEMLNMTIKSDGEEKAVYFEVIGNIYDNPDLLPNEREI